MSQTEIKKFFKTIRFDSLVSFLICSNFFLVPKQFRSNFWKETTQATQTDVSAALLTTERVKFTSNRLATKTVIVINSVASA